MFKCFFNDLGYNVLYILYIKVGVKGGYINIVFNKKK